MKALALAEYTKEPAELPDGDWGYYWPRKFVHDTWWEHKNDRAFTVTGTYEGDYERYPYLRDHDWMVCEMLYEREHQIVEEALKPEGEAAV